MAKSSAGLICAKRAGVRADIIRRARQIMDVMKDGVSLKPWTEAVEQRNALPSAVEVDVVDYYLSVGNWETATEDDLRTLLQKIARV